MQTYVYKSYPGFKVRSLKMLKNKSLTYILRPATKAEVERFRIKDELGYENPKGAKMRHTEAKT